MYVSMFKCKLSTHCICISVQHINLIPCFSDIVSDYAVIDMLILILKCFLLSGLIFLGNSLKVIKIFFYPSLGFVVVSFPVCQSPRIRNTILYDL